MTKTSQERYSAILLKQTTDSIEADADWYVALKLTAA